MLHCGMSMLQRNDIVTRAQLPQELSKDAIRI